MITTVIKKSDDYIVGFEISGHAASRQEINSVTGEAYDMICNSVSVLSQSILIGLTEVLNFKINYEMKDGFLSLNLKGFSSENLAKAQVLLKTFELSIECIIRTVNESFGNKKRNKYINLLKEEV